MTNNLHKLIWPSLFLFWLTLASCLVYYVSAESVSKFDPNYTLVESSLSPDFDEEFINWLVTQTRIDGRSVVHITSQECRCNLVSQRHRESVAKLAEDHLFNNLYITTDNPHFVPSTPAIAIIDEQNQLVYFGPYSTGYFCSAGDGIAEPFINGSYQANNRATVIADATGCYCHLERS
ncbi:Secreted protein, containing thioredoxin-like domain [Pseudoalteromonas luteoviolacea B = ATCC 29581]|nr:Secreted protein, containing thioredoxin-like domain [Pseudoalteromonas luteoviolacea B = ATCC 29581]